MKRTIAAILVCLATAAGAQSYADRAETEKLEAAMKAVDKAKMDEARVAARAPASRTSTELEMTPLQRTTAVVLGLAVLGGIGWSARRKK